MRIAKNRALDANVPTQRVELVEFCKMLYFHFVSLFDFWMRRDVPPSKPTLEFV
jgi:hypothetical protein